MAAGHHLSLTHPSPQLVLLSSRSQTEDNCLTRPCRVAALLSSTHRTSTPAMTSSSAAARLPTSSPAPSIPLTPTKPSLSAAPLPHQHPTPRGLHTIPQPFHFHSSKHRRTPQHPSPTFPSASPSRSKPCASLSHAHVHPAVNKENVAGTVAAVATGVLVKPLPPFFPSTPGAPPTRPSSILGSRTPQSLFPAQRRPHLLHPHTDIVVRTTAFTAAPSPAIAAADAASVTLAGRRLLDDFAVDAASLAEILHPPPSSSGSLAALAFTTSDRQSMLTRRDPFVRHSILGGALRLQPRTSRTRRAQAESLER